MAKFSRQESRIRRHRRVRKKIFGTPEQPRMNVYRSATEFYVQVIDDLTGHTLVSASSIDQELRSQVEGLTKTQKAQAVGKAIAKRALEKGITKVVFDRGGFVYIGRVKAMADAAREGGLVF